MLFLLLSLRCSFKREICVCSLPVWWRSRRLWSCFYILSLFLLLCVMRVLAFVVLWRNVLTSKRRRVELSAMLTVCFLSFLLSFFLFFPLCVKKGKGSFPLVCCCWLLLNPDSRAQRENQDLLFWIFFHHEPSLSFLRRTKHDQKHQIIIGPFFSSIRHI